MILRLSQKLAKKLNEGKLCEMPLDENPYSDWSCHLFTADRTQYIIMSNTKSLYSCVMYGKGIINDGVFIERALSTIREFMADDGKQFPYRKFIAPASRTVQFSKAPNRSVTSSMNQLVGFAEVLLIEDDLSLHEVGFKLNDFLLGTGGREISRLRHSKRGIQVVGKQLRGSTRAVPPMSICARRSKRPNASVLQPQRAEVAHSDVSWSSQTNCIRTGWPWGVTTPRLPQTRTCSH